MNQVPNLAPVQTQKIAQEQKLMPQQMQSLEILTVPLMDLENKINEELSSNPVLELASDSPREDRETSSDDSGSDDLSSDPVMKGSPDTSEDLSARMTSAGLNDDYDQFQQDDDSATWTDFLQSIGSDSFSGETSGSTDHPETDDRRDFFFNSIAAEPTLQEFLEEQLRLSDIPESLRKIAEEIIGCVDDSGYLKVPLEEIAQNCKTSTEQVEKALKQVQKFDPPGIAARTLEECLLLQLARQGKGRSLAAQLA